MRHTASHLLRPDHCQQLLPRSMILHPSQTACHNACVMLLVQDGLLILDRPVSQYLPQLSGTQMGQATPLHFLSHSAGLPACKPYYRDCNARSLSKHSNIGDRETRQRIYNWIHHEELAYPVGDGMIYSDLGFILLTELVEALSGDSLAEFCLSRIFVPLGADDTFFYLADRPGVYDPSKKTSLCRNRR